MVRREQKAFLERADHMVLSSHRESVGVLNSEEKHPRGGKKDQGDGSRSGEGFVAQLKHHLCQGGLSSFRAACCFLSWVPVSTSMA